MERLGRILNIVAALFTIPAAIATVLVTLQSLAPGWPSNVLGWMVAFSPTILIMCAAIAFLLLGPFFAAAIYICALGAYAIRIGFDSAPLTRDSVMWFVIGCTSFAVIIAMTLGAYFVSRILKLIADMAGAFADRKGSQD